jgi:tRNA dimethylallyltransferase
MNLLTKRTYGKEHIRSMNKLVIVCGPTATGKTAVAVALAKKFHGELISADSRQVYRGMDIGTGKDIASLQGIPIWMYDVVNPDEPFSVSQFQKKAQGYIQDIRKRNKLPILVGGTGLYIQSLVQTIPTNTVKPNMLLRKKLEKQSLESLQYVMKQECMHMWGILNDSDRNNPRRLIRKIELGRSGMTAVAKPSRYKGNICWIGLTAPFLYLYTRIDARVMKRVEEGIVDEVKKLLKKGYTWDLPSMSGLGYREWKNHIEGKAPMEEAVQKWKYDEHGYARRQITWLKRNKDIQWFDISKPGHIRNIERVVQTWYTRK